LLPCGGVWLLSGDSGAECAGLAHDWNWSMLSVWASGGWIATFQLPTPRLREQSLRVDRAKLEIEVARQAEFFEPHELGGDGRFVCLVPVAGTPSNTDCGERNGRAMSA